MRLRVIGSSPSWPNQGGAQSGYLIEEAGRLLLDCGPGVLVRLRAAETWPRVDAIAITHLHQDHWADLVPWALGLANGPGREAPCPELWLPPGASEALRALDPILCSGTILERFDVHEYEEAKPFRAGGFDVTPRALPHYQATSFGFRVQGTGATLAYSGDSGPTPVLADLARDVDVFLCEATLGAEEPGLRGHLTAEEALAAALAAGARRLLIVHRPDEIPLPESLERARDGSELVLGRQLPGVDPRGC